ncbi:hypothetical protein CE91St47_04400 [Eubacteriales bacterium]|nr:hypothetical protein CE91St47_04400 [Eubacteriales bacterium]
MHANRYAVHSCFVDFTVQIHSNYHLLPPNNTLIAIIQGLFVWLNYSFPLSD